MACLKRSSSEATICQLNSAAPQTRQPFLFSCGRYLAFEAAGGSRSIRKWYSITFVVSRRGKFNGGHLQSTANCFRVLVIGSLCPTPVDARPAPAEVILLDVWQTALHRTASGASRGCLPRCSLIWCGHVWRFISECG